MVIIWSFREQTKLRWAPNCNFGQATNIGQQYGTALSRATSVRCSAAAGVRLLRPASQPAGQHDLVAFGRVNGNLRPARPANSSNWSCSRVLGSLQPDQLGASNDLVAGAAGAAEIAASPASPASEASNSTVSRVTLRQVSRRVQQFSAAPAQRRFRCCRELGIQPVPDGRRGQETGR